MVSFLLLVAIEYENIEMIELLLSYSIDTGEALLFAIDEQFVEGRPAVCVSMTDEIIARSSSSR